MDKQKNRYFELKKELDSLRDNITLNRWKILSKAYKMGKHIWGKDFTIHRLSWDMEMPYTTCKRCLALDRANKRTWRFIKDKKISVFKVAMICSEKSKHYQDEIIDLVIKDKLSTYQISDLRVNNLKDINKERHRLAVENGYSRADSAYYQFNRWVERGYIFLNLTKEMLPNSRINTINTKLIELNKQINKFVEHG